ncbi:preprotein translocase subunit YajC [Candidatus Contubernalis alkaliaceticus]|uniref:preprotein translocase subunit YajC n=1 Tax=Candidatus Contubernalis alkaliaceticus TaxID=338645 RepID=UPI001F4C310C|nr:preprotein translocase subunit YajC [Candidatus Contubernalis alkalaceticus]UNC92619.1 preprotein translocase subunit YajC [Candidatus Contubernalis alkalaceticus]
MEFDLIGLLPIAVFFGIMYFMLIRPQQKQQKVRQEMLSSLNKGDKIITIGGMYGTIKEIKEDDLTVTFSDNVVIKMARYGVERIRE